MGHKGVSKRKPKTKLNPAVSVNTNLGATLAGVHPFENNPVKPELKGRDANLLKSSQTPSGGSSKAHRKR